MEQVEEVVTSDAMEQSTASDDVIDDNDNNHDESNPLADVTKDLEEGEGDATVSRADACNVFFELIVSLSYFNLNGTGQM